MVGFGMIIPDIQFRAEQMGAQGWMIGAILASTFLVQLLASQFWGRLSDRLGRKTVFVSCTLLSAASMVAYALAPNLLFILLSRILAGFGAANVAVAQAAIADATTGPERTVALGRISAALTTGLILGPAVGGEMASRFGSYWIGIVGASASFAGALLVWIVAEMAPGSIERKKLHFLAAPLLKDFPALRPFLVAAVVAWFSLATLEGTFGRLIKATLGLGEREFGYIFAFESVIGVLVQAVLLSWILAKLTTTRALPIAYLLQGLGLALTPFAPGLAILVVASGLYALGAGVANPAVNGVCSQIVPEERQGELFGLMQSARAIGFILGPILGGALFDVWHAGPYLLAGFVCVVSAALVAKAAREWRPAEA